MRILAKGYRNLWTPYAELYHYESQSRGPEDSPEKYVRFKREVEYMKQRWGELLLNDPSYNPNLSLDTSVPKLSFPPRVRKPWMEHKN